MSKNLLMQVKSLSTQLGLSKDPESLLDTLKATIFAGIRDQFKKPIVPSDAQMDAFLMVSSAYKLNPILKQIHAYPNKAGGITPVVGIDGWYQITNTHEQFNGVEFIEGDGKCTAIFYRKDREHPVKVTEFHEECFRPTEPWKQMPKRMLRHKAYIQGARMAFGFSGIFDEDEAKAIVEKDMGAVQFADGEIPVVAAAQTPAPKKEEVVSRLPSYPADRFDNNLKVWKKKIVSGDSTLAKIKNKIQTQFVFTNLQLGKLERMNQEAVLEMKEKPQGETVLDDFVREMEEAENEAKK